MVALQISETTISPTEWSYIAGLIDGEGTISLAWHGSRHHPETQIYISNTSVKLMDWLKERLQGWGAVYSKAQKPPKKHIYTFRFYWKTYTELLNAVRPYLVIKQEQANLVLEWMKLKNWGQGSRVFDLSLRQNEIIARVKALNQRGVPL